METNSGRPAVLDEELKRTVCLLVRAGCSRRRAAAYCGIDEGTIRKAAERDEAFRRELGEASVSMEVDYLAKIRAWTDRSWRAAAWLLEKSFPEEYGKEGRTEEKENSAHPLTAFLEKLQRQATERMTGETEF